MTGAFISLIILFCSFGPCLPPPVPSPDQRAALNLQSQEEFDSLFDSVAEELVPLPKEEGPPPLTDNDLAVFDPCYKQGEIHVDGNAY